jgi:acetyl-CoA C-acetyltransferase
MQNDPKLEPVILSAARTPVGRFRGTLSTVPAVDLGALVIQEAVRRANILEPADIREVIMGNVVSAGLGQNPARQAALYSGLPATVGATTVNKVCGSGLKSVMLAAASVKAGDGDLYVAGGMENMSRAPFLVYGRLGELRYGHEKLVDSLVCDGLWDQLEDWGMGDAAEFIGEEYKVTRQAMDEWALNSHRKAIAASDSGKFKVEIVTVEIKDRKGNVSLVSEDETFRRDTTLEALAALKPVFKEGGKVTAGNAPGLNDGAAALVITSREKADRMGSKPLARILGYTQRAVEPRYIFIAPAYAIPDLLDKVGWTLADVDLVELNEAFAAQVMADGYAMKDMGWDWDKVNVHGGAIALGHPLGASGAKILTTLIYALKDRGLKRGIAALCLGGAEAVAMAIEIED